MRTFLSAPVLLAIAALSGAAAEMPAPPLVKLRGLPFTAVEIRDAFWLPRQETNRLASIPANLSMLEKAGNIRNFELAGAGATNGFTGPVFMDSDLYKGLEAASYSLSTHPDAKLARQLDGIIATIAHAQQPDGYLNTHFTVKEPTKRWTNLRDWHELYCAGHLFEAAVAHYQATGQRNLLDVATRLADHIDSVFGPGKRMGYPGHPEIELALVKLWRVTGEQRYFNLARFFIENRGRHFFAEEHGEPVDRYDGSYWQDDVPITEHRNIKGHAVRAAYLLSGATDIAAETGDPQLLRMIGRVWRNATQKNLYVTGGIGPSAHNEGFTADYDLPNRTAYQETCASVALAQWNHRLALLYGDARYADVMERSLYNGVLAGVSLDGTRFFYVNPLESVGTHHRSDWFGCACCPPNVARTLASLGGYAYAVSPEALWINLYIQSAATANVHGQKVVFDVTTDYPWNGKVTVRPKLAEPSRFELRLRVPGWCRDASVAVNRVEPGAVLERGYLVIAREWREGDVVELNLPMPVEKIAAHPAVKDDAGQIALQRGPLVYCLEQADLTSRLAPVYLPAESELAARMAGTLLGGVVVLEGTAQSPAEMAWKNQLYQPLAKAHSIPITAIPYYAWDNRSPGPMKVWLPIAPEPTVTGGLERQAEVSLSFTSSNCQPGGINDGLECKASGDQPPAVCHWWPHKGGTEWAQYRWRKPVQIAGAKVFWFDDTGRGQCRLPAAWQLQYADGTDWRPVQVTDPYQVARDQWCDVHFQPITTTALRLVVEMQSGWAAGVHEWQVIEAAD